MRAKKVSHKRELITCLAEEQPTGGGYMITVSHQGMVLGKTTSICRANVARQAVNLASIELKCNPGKIKLDRVTYA